MLGLPVQAADAKAEPAEAAAAMERAKRQAANPMKAILEASKVKRKVAGEPDPPSAVANAAAATTATSATTATTAPLAVPRASGTATATATATASGTATATAALSSATARNSSLVTQGAVAAEALPTLTIAEPIAPSAALPSAATPTAALAPGWAQPRLTDMVEPAIPARVLDDIGGLVEVRADLNLRADGSVASVTLVQPVPRQLARYVTTALERWRYAPLPADQVHRVQLVFNEQR